MKKGLAEEEVLLRASQEEGSRRWLGKSWVRRDQDKPGKQRQQNRALDLIIGFVLHRKTSWAAGNPSQRQQARGKKQGGSGLSRGGKRKERGSVAGPGPQSVSREVPRAAWAPSWKLCGRK